MVELWPRRVFLATCSSELIAEGFFRKSPSHLADMCRTSTSCTPRCDGTGFELPQDRGRWAVEAKLARCIVHLTRRISCGSYVVEITRSIVKRSQPLSWPAGARPACDRGCDSQSTVGKTELWGFGGFGEDPCPPGALPATDVKLRHLSSGVPEDPRALIGRGCRNRQGEAQGPAPAKETRWRQERRSSAFHTPPAGIGRPVPSSRCQPVPSLAVRFRLGHHFSAWAEVTFPPSRFAAYPHDCSGVPLLWYIPYDLLLPAAPSLPSVSST